MVMMMVVMMRRRTSGTGIHHTIVLARARQQPVRWRCVRVRTRQVMARMGRRWTLAGLLRMVVWRGRRLLLLLRWWWLLVRRWWRTVLRRMVTAGARRATVWPNRLRRLAGWSAGWRRRAHAARVGRRKTHRGAHVVRWTHRWMHSRPVPVALARGRRARCAAVRALVLQVLLQVVQWLW